VTVADSMAPAICTGSAQRQQTSPQAGHGVIYFVTRVARSAVRAPFALSLAVALFVTTLWTRTHPGDAEPLFRWASTNVHNLSYAPIRSFVVSALFVPDGHVLVNAGLLLAAIIPLERRIGTLRALLVFASAHVIATAATEGWVWYAVHLGAMPMSAEFQDDVGVSYGLFCAVAAALYFARPRFRAIGVAALAAYVIVPFVAGPDLTTTGHMLSLAIGLAWWSLLGRMSTRRAQRRAARHTLPAE